MQAIKAIYDGSAFVPRQPIPVKGKYEVVITFVEPIDESEDYSLCYLLEPDMTKTPVLGRLNGLIEIPADFDEPLEEMKEYMY
jgi:hypothetical protein